MNHIEAMKQALEALEASRHLLEIEVNKAIARDAADAWIREKEAELRQHDDAITSLRTAIEQMEKQRSANEHLEPVGTLNITSYKGLGNYDFDYLGSLPDGTYSVYTTPPAAPYRAVKTVHEGKPYYVSEPAAPVQEKSK